ncbi:MAG: hypothetical protein WAO41_08640 [Candidatus Nanopelagicales bacterium]
MRPHAHADLPGLQSHGAVSDDAPGSAAPPNSTAPYAEALRELAFTRGPSALMRASVPGHAATSTGGVGAYFGADLMCLDIAPLTDGIDADPAGNVTPLDQARELAAQAWGAHTTWFLTSGASQGNLITCVALASAATQLRPAQHPSVGGRLTQQIIVQRSVHSSVMDGLTLAGIDPVTVAPGLDEARGIAHGLTPADLDAALSEHPAALGAYVVSPSYFGAVSDIRGLAEVAHRHGVPLIVDEAWGAHLGFHPRLPVNGLRLGADVAISSTHKLGGSLGQSAMLHLGHGPWADLLGDHIERARRMVTSTSESALLLASLDLARRQLVCDTDAIGASIETADRVRAGLRRDSRFQIVTDEMASHQAVFAIDPLRIVIDTRGCGITGHEVRARLFHDHGIQVEMSTDAVIVALVAAGSQLDTERFINALQHMPHAGQRHTTVHQLPEAGARVMSLRAATFAASEIVPASAAVGRISADSLAAYPPGVPNVLPGELITQQVVDFLQASAQAPHGYVRGAHDPQVDTMRVLCHTD